MGRMRLPKPAANTIAVFGKAAVMNADQSGESRASARPGPQRPRQMVLVPEQKRVQQRMSEVLCQVALDPRQMVEVLRLAVPLLETGENAEDLGCALRRHRSVGGSEAFRVEVRVDRGAAADV